eukprot:444579-Rhodomonas_salina.2
MMPSTCATRCSRKDLFPALCCLLHAGVGHGCVCRLCSALISCLNCASGLNRASLSRNEEEHTAWPALLRPARWPDQGAAWALSRNPPAWYPHESYLTSGQRAADT